MTTHELKPCPFCGSINIDFGICVPTDGANYNYAYCKSCGCHGPSDPKATTETKAATLWNERHSILGA